MNVISQIKRKYYIRILVLVLCILVVLFLALVAYFYEKSNDYISNVRIRSEDSCISVKWEMPLINNAKGIYLSISGNGTCVSMILPSNARSYYFTEGVHGVKYRVSIRELYKDGRHGDKHSEERLYLDYKKLPDLPILTIDTVSGELPSAEVVVAPEGLLGASVVNNNPISGSLFMKDEEDTLLSSKIQISVRGNTSSANAQKQSYKLVLNDSQDLLQFGKKHARKEWILLNVGDSLNNYIGNYFSKLCVMDWTVEGKFVNLIINGDWRGIYYLSESVNQENNTDRVSSSGYIIENDAYWWKEDKVLFKTNRYINHMAFTITYPKKNSIDSNSVIMIQNYMNCLEDKIYSLDEDVLNDIDVNSFVSWIMIRDVMLTGDVAGSNIYYYIYELNDNNDYKLYIGPLWDFDICMKTSLGKEWFKDINSWSMQHTNVWYTYYACFFQMPSFRAAYKEKWGSISTTMSSEFSNYLEMFYDEYGVAIEESRKLDAARWNRESYTTLRDEITYDEQFIQQRVEWISEQVEGW